MWLTTWKLKDAVNNIEIKILLTKGNLKYVCLRDAVSGKATLSKQFCLPSENGSTLKGKNLLKLVANSFLLEKTPFPKELEMQEKGNHKIYLPYQITESLQGS